MRTPVKQVLGKTGLLCGLAVFVAASAHASPIINFNGIYATSNLSFVLPTPVDSGGTRTWEYSDTTPITPAANYTGPAVYGGFQTQSTNGVPENLLWLSGLVKDGYGTTNTKLWAASTTTGSTLTAMFVFKPTVESGKTVSFDATSSINYFMTTGDQGARFVLNDGGTWYISSNALTLAASSTLTGSSLLNSTWAAFDPVGVAPLPAFPVSGYTSLGSSFDNILGIGVYFSGNRPLSSQAPYTSLGTFTVDAAVAPEPVSGALFLVAGGLLALRRRYHLRHHHNG